MLMSLSLSVCITLVLSAAVAAAATPLVRFLAMRQGFYALPVRDRWHSRPVPLLGGLAIIAGFTAGVSQVEDWTALVPLLIGSGLMALLGIADDIWTIRPSMKLVVQMLTAGLLLVLVPAPSITGSVIVDQLIAFTWLVGITNAFNLLDNMDGLSAGVAAIAGAGYLGYVLAGGQGAALAIPVAAFLGATLGFLIYNFPPASIFMGDGGSFFLGSFLAALGLILAPSADARALPTALVPMLILLVPIFDTAFVMYTRRRAGKSAMVGGRDHTSHRLVALGVTERIAVLTLYTLAAGGALLAISVGRLQLGSTLALVFLYTMIVLAIGVVLGNTAEPAAEADAAHAPLISEIAYRRRIYEIVLDTGLLTLAYYAAFRLRFQGPDFDVFFPPFVRSLPIVIGVQVAGLYFAGKYRQVWRSVSATELATLLRGLVMGTAGSVLFVLFVFRFERFSRGVFVIDALVAWFLLVVARAVTSSIDSYLRKARVRGARALVYGAGRGGTLLIRDVLQNAEAGCVPVGFIDDNPEKWRLRVEGIPVLGGSDQLEDLVRRYQIAEVLVSIRELDPGRLTDLLSRCLALGVRLRRMRFSIDEVRGPTVVRHEHHGGRSSA